MPPKGKKKAISTAAPEERRKMRTSIQQYEVERRIMTEIEDGFLVALERIREWTTEGGGRPGGAEP